MAKKDAEIKEVKAAQAEPAQGENAPKIDKETAMRTAAAWLIQAAQEGKFTIEDIETISNAVKQAFVANATL